MLPVLEALLTGSLPLPLEDEEEDEGISVEDDCEGVVLFISCRGGPGVERRGRDFYPDQVLKNATVEE